MKSIILSIFFASICLQLSAQEKKFIFIQSDNRQPFYVSLNGKIYSSSGSGYIILSKLSDGDYSFNIGFAKDASPEQPFSLSLKKDMGLTLKNFGEKGWGLFDHQSLAVTMAGTPLAKDNLAAAPKKEDEEPIYFSQKSTAAEATPIDTSVREVAASAIENPMKDTSVEALKVTEPDVSTIDNSDTTPAVVVDTITTGATSLTEVPKEATEAAEKDATPRAVKRKARKASVNKVSQQNNQDGVSLTFVDKDNQSDTIKVIIPSEMRETTNETEDATTKPVIDKVTSSEVADGISSDTTKISPAKVVVKEHTKTVCKSLATDDDYTRLRRKMAQKTTDDEMRTEANKFFRNKCMSTSQVKAMSTLFLSDESRLMFFSQAYPHVSDPEVYSSLEGEFIDRAFIEKFRLAINNN